MDPHKIFGDRVVDLIRERIPPSAHHTAPYDDFIRYQLEPMIENIVVSVPAVDAQCYKRIRFARMQLALPHYTDSATHMVRPLGYEKALGERRNLVADIYVEATMFDFRQEGGPDGPFLLFDVTIYRQLHIGSIPVILGSILDPDRARNKNDHGKLVVSGLLRILQSQESFRDNRSQIHRIKGQHCLELRSTHAHARSSSTLKIRLSGSRMVVQVPFCTDVEAVWFLKGMGLTVEHVLSLVPNPKHVEPLRAYLIASHRGAKNKMTDVILGSTEFLPHCRNFAQKQYVICDGIMEYGLLKLGLVPLTDTDSYVEKTLALPGFVLGLQMAKCLRQMLRTAQRVLFKRIISGTWCGLPTIFNPNTMTNGFRFALGTSTMPISGGNTKEKGKGVSVIAPASVVASRRVLCVVNKAVSRDGSKHRQLYETSRGFLCAFSTPEGRAVGLTGELTTLALPSTGFQADWVRMAVAPLLSQEEDEVRVSVNGTWVGWVPKLEPLLAELDRRRLELRLPIDLSFAPVSPTQLDINCGIGMCCRGVRQLGEQVERPGGILPNYVLVTPEEYFLRLGTFVTAHKGIELVSRTLANIPLYNAIPPPRLLYSSSMLTSLAEGPTIRSSVASSINTKSYVLQNAQVPLMQTCGARIHEEHISTGANVFIGILGSQGLQEDGVIISQRFSDLGGLMEIFKRTYHVSEREGTSSTETFGIPGENVLFKKEAIHGQPGRSPYDALDPVTGLPIKGKTIKAGDVLVGVVRTCKNTGVQRDCSVTVKSLEDLECTISEVHVTHGITATSAKMKNVRIVTTALRPVRKQDKTSNHAGQKATVSDIRPVEDMPYDMITGCPLDMMFGIHSIPSRMTINMLIEIIASLGITLAAELRDATTFINTTAEVLDWTRKVLKTHGRSTGTMMVDGISGLPMQNLVLAGFLFTVRLNHNAVEKASRRGRDGPVNIRTQQPVSGRARDGGGKFGYQEKDAALAAGVPDLVTDRQCDSSDGCNLIICKTCRQQLTRGKGDFCLYCRSKTDWEVKFGPHLARLLFAEFAGFGVGLRM